MHLYQSQKFFSALILNHTFKYFKTFNKINFFRKKNVSFVDLVPLKYMLYVVFYFTLS